MDDVEFPNVADGAVFKHIAIPLRIKCVKIAGSDSLRRRGRSMRNPAQLADRQTSANLPRPRVPARPQEASGKRGGSNQQRTPSPAAMRTESWPLATVHRDQDRDKPRQLRARANCRAFLLAKKRKTLPHLRSARTDSVQQSATVELRNCAFLLQICCFEEMQLSPLFATLSRMFT